MASLTLPAVHTQKLFIYLHLPSGALSSFTWAISDSDDFLFLFETEVEIAVPASVQAALIPAFNEHLDKQTNKAKADFAIRIRELEETRGKYLALEG